MEMLQLRYFYESAMEESFSKTARKYMVPVSSVSASVKRLEQELETELFVRTGNRIVLSDKGRQFLSVVGNTLSQLDMGVSALATKMTEKQTLSILVRNTRETLVKWIASFHRTYPVVSFKLTFDDEPENYENYDIIISSPEDELKDYESFSWRRYRVQVEALDTDPLCRETVTLSQLQDRQFVTTSSQRGGFKIFKEACERQGFTPKVFLECDDYGCRNIALRSCACLGLNLRNDTNDTQTNMTFLRVTDFQEYLDINVYYRKEAYEGNIKLFLDLLKSSAARP